MLGLKLNHVSKRGHWWKELQHILGFPDFVEKTYATMSCKVLQLCFHLVGHKVAALQGSRAPIQYKDVI